MTTPAPTIFISYSHKDEDWKDKFLPQLRALERAGSIAVWDDRKIDGGETWYPEIKAAMEQAAVSICLISSDYLASRFCAEEEVPYLLQRRGDDGMILIPVLLRPCIWKAFKWLKEIQMLPRDGKSVVVDFRGIEDAAFADVANLVFEIVDNPKYEPPEPPPPRWPPPEKVETQRLPETGAELFGRRAELELLDDVWESGSTNVVSLVAWGGVGKSRLVNKWLEQMKADNYRGARRVYAWSFYSQGTSERASSADLFINNALEWFGDPDPTAGSPWDKGERLAALVRRERTLLLLDGLEPLQSPHAHERGKIKDPALATLVEELAQQNPGVCLITTRERVTDLQDFSETALHKDLEQISNEAGRALLRVGGVQGTDAELEQATRDFGNHAYAVQLLAVYLLDIPGHHVSQASAIPDLDIPVERGKHPRRMLAAFERRFGDGPEIEILRMLGLFDRPADGASIAALREAPPIPGLTEHIQNLSEADWLRHVVNLRRKKLIAPADHHRLTDLDAHPLVREHFAQQLKKNAPEAWREGNDRLYKHLQQRVKHLPDTMEEMSYLFSAMIHGCQAGRHKDAFEKVYWPRISREEQAFLTKTLGAIGAELGIMSYFFEAPWHKPVAALSRANQSFVRFKVGFDLRAIGRLTEALEPLKASMKHDISGNDWFNAALTAGYISGVYLNLGDLPQSLKYARQGVSFADRSGDKSESIRERTKLANTLQQTGETSQAKAVFLEAEEIQKGYKPKYPLLHNVSGFRYCSLLLDEGEYREVQVRARQSLKWMAQNPQRVSLLATALDNLSLGRAYQSQAQQQGDASEFDLALTHIEKSVEGLRYAQRQDHLPRGLLARAELYRLRGEFDQARADLDDAMRVAQRGSMGLYGADCHLERARLYLAHGEKDRAREHLLDAKEMIERMGYHRRDEDVQEIEGLLGENAGG
ncbi:MAG: TIR domain-containing protein [Rubrivivax sp.]|nr:TIR domain-containing protein [Pyrinomonadaceae bacterium]